MWFGYPGEAEGDKTKVGCCVDKDDVFTRERESCVILTIATFQLESLDVRCDGGLEGPEGRLLEVCAGKLTKCSVFK